MFLLIPLVGIIVLYFFIQGGQAMLAISAGIGFALMWLITGSPWWAFSGLLLGPAAFGLALCIWVMIMQRM
jgi:hypothetical protein